MQTLVECNAIQVVACPDPFSLNKVVFEEEVRHSLLEIVQTVQPSRSMRRKARVTVNGEIVPRDEWPYYYPAPGSYIHIRVVPQAPIAAIVIGIAAMLAQVGVSGALVGIGWSAMAAGIVGSLVATAVSVVGYLLMSALVRPPSVRAANRMAASSTSSVAGDSKDTPTRYITGARNKSSPYGVVPRVYGKIRMTPPLGSMYYTELSNVTAGRMQQAPATWTPSLESQLSRDVAAGRAMSWTTLAGERTGEEQWMRMMVCWGHGPLDVTDMRVSTTPLNNFQGVEMDHRAGYPEDTRLKLYSYDIYEESLDIALTYAGGIQYRTTQQDADEFSIDIAFNGLFQSNREGGGKQTYGVAFNIFYRKDGDTGAYTQAGSLNVSAASSSAVRRGFRFAFPQPGKYSIGVQRITADNNSTDIADESFWGTLRSVKYEYPVTEKNVSLSVIRIKASEQLQGTVDELNGLVHSILRDWDRVARKWVRRKTNNPASIVLHILTDKEANAKAVEDSRVNFDNLAEFHEFCEDNGFSCNTIFDSSTDVEAAMVLAAACGRATPGMPDSKYGVVIDKSRSIISQHFTPRNTWNFKASQTFIHDIHGFRCTFPDEANDYQDTEVTVYVDGYNEGNATIFEELKLEGITNYEQIHKLARYYLAVAEYQREIINFDTDFEYLTCERGSRIKFSHDVMLIGLGAGRVNEIDKDSTGNVIYAYLDDEVTFEYGVSYAIRFRLRSGESLYCLLVNPSTSDPVTTDYVKFSTPINPGVQTPPQKGDLFSFGESGKETEDLIVLGIEPKDGLSATLTCTIYNEAVYTAADKPIPKYQPKISIPVDWRVPTVSAVRSDGSVLFWAQGSWQSQILVSFSFPPIMPGYVGIEGQIRRVGDGAGAWSSVKITLADASLGFTQVEDKVQYEMRFRYIKDNNYVGPWTEPSVTHTVEGKTAPPEDVEGFQAYQDHGLIVLKWTPVLDKDLKEYKIKYCQAGSADWANAPTLTTATKGTNMTTKTLPQGVYDFMIKAVDLSGNESNTAAVVSAVRVIEVYVPVMMMLVGSFPDGTQWTPDGTGLDEQAYESSHPTFQNLVYDYRNNVWRPKDQASASLQSMSPLSRMVVTPYEDHSFESLVWTMSGDLLRIWIQAESMVPYPSYSDYPKKGVWSPKYQVRAWPHGGDVPDWTDEQVMVFGDASVRFYDMQWRVSWKSYGNSDATYENIFVLRNLTYGADTQPKFLADTVDVSVGGTVMKYGSYFNGIPAITANVIAGPGVSVTITDIGLYECTFHVFDADGNDVGGKVSWMAQSTLGATIPGGY